MTIWSEFVLTVLTFKKNEQEKENTQCFETFQFSFLSVIYYYYFFLLKYNGPIKKIIKSSKKERNIYFNFFSNDPEK